MQRLRVGIDPVAQTCRVVTLTIKTLQAASRDYRRVASHGHDGFHACSCAIRADRSRLLRGVTVRGLPRAAVIASRTVSTLHVDTR